MTTILGSGDYRYELAQGWGTLPDGWSFGEVSAVTTDRRDNVYVFNRGLHPMIVFDRQGNFLRSWGEGLFTRAHGLHMGPDDSIYCTDEGGHTVRKCTLEGKVLLTIGVPGKAAAHMSGDPFNRCTHTALSPSGDIFVSDGYGNARIHKYSPDGKLIRSWGGPGTSPGQFNLPHNICCDPDGWVYVADRENHRVQVFDVDGRYETQWNNLHRPSGLFIAPGRCPLCYIGETGPGMSVNMNTPNLGARISIVTHKGEILAQLGDRFPGLGPGQFFAPHGIAVDSRGDIYVGEVSRTAWGNRNPPGSVPPENLRCLQKLARLA